MVSSAADTIRMEISNAFGGSDLNITAASIALPTNQTAGIGGIQAKSIKKLTFSGEESFIIPNGAMVFSDPIEFPIDAESIVSVTLYLEGGQTTNLITAHPGSRTTSYFAPGDQLNDPELTDAASAEHWYFISAVEGLAKRRSKAIAIVGDSITDGRGSTTNGNDRWPDQLLHRLQQSPRTSSIAVLNQAAGGNRILADGLGPNALGRIDRDVIAHSGVRYAIIFEGVNDIGYAPSSDEVQSAVAERVIQAYKQMILRLHRHNIAAYGATITPMSGPGQEYGTPSREKARQTVNEWIRTSGEFDAVIDFDKAVRDPDHPDQLLEEYDVDDHLHLNPAGYRAMAEAIDLDLFGV